VTTISIDLSASGINKALRELERYKQSVVSNTKLLGEQLTEEGGRIAAALYEQAKDQGYDNFTGGMRIERKSVDVQSVPTSDGHSIVALGEAVCFYEFGAGMYALESLYPDSSMIPSGVVVEPGAVSSRYDPISHPYWFYGGRRYEGINPTFAMYNASKHIHDHFEEKAKRLFG